MIPLIILMLKVKVDKEDSLNISIYLEEMSSMDPSRQFQLRDMMILWNIGKQLASYREQYSITKLD